MSISPGTCLLSHQIQSPVTINTMKGDRLTIYRKQPHSALEGNIHRHNYAI